MAEFKDIYNFKNWWTLLAATGGAVAVAATPKLWVPGWLVGLGLLLFGAGEWINRPSTVQKQTAEGLKGFRVVPANRWQFNALGFALDTIGAALFGLGIFWLVWFR
jgi:hypothetical protein